MYIRAVKKQRSKTSKVFYQYTLAQTVRVDGKVKQRAILYLGSDPLLGDRANRATVLRLLQAKIFRNGELFDGEGPENQAPEVLRELAGALFEKYRIKYGDAPSKNEASIPPAPAKAEYHNIDIKSLEVADVKTFGAEHLCKQVLDRLRLADCFSSLGMTKKQSDKALLSIAARAIFSSSEYRTSQILRTNSALPECFGIVQAITHKQLYSVADRLFENKGKIDTFLFGRIRTLFHLEDRLVIFDISNTYFEGRKAGSKIAKYGRSKEKRSDCPLVVFTGVINAEGFIRHSRIYEGNKADTATLDDMIADLEKYSPAGVERTIVMDAGIATEENLESIMDKGYEYVCVSRKRLKDYPVDPQKHTITQLTDRDRNKVELRIFTPKEYNDTWMYVQSEAKRAKEESMDEKLKMRFEEELEQIKNALHKKGGTKKINKVWERIGRAKEKNKHVSSKYTIDLTEKEGLATALAWSVKQNRTSEDKTKGVYFIRTNIKKPNEKELWNIYNTIREVEATFRCLKSDLNIRPVHHQNDSRIEAHIYQTVLAYQLVNTIRHMLKEKGIRHDWTNVVRIMNTHTIQTIELPTDTKKIHLRKPSKPIKEAQQIYTATNCTKTQTAVKKYVVYH
jgi:transposase